VATHYSGTAAAALLLLLTPHGLGQTNFAGYFETRLQQARARFQAGTNGADAAWQLGRACFDRAEFSTNDTQRAALAIEGVGVCRPLVAREPRLAAAHYYLSMNLGQLARTKMLGALPLVDEMERHFKLAAALDPKLDHAGPERCLGLLYRDAPGWPASVGSKAKARAHLVKAAEIAPEFPENRLNLLESALKWNDRKLGVAELKSMGELLPSARTNLTGAAWDAAWSDWSGRWDAARVKAKSLWKLKD